MEEPLGSELKIESSDKPQRVETAAEYVRGSATS